MGCKVSHAVPHKIAAAPIHRGTEPNVDKTAPAAISTNEPGSKTNEAASDDQNSTVGNQVASQILTEPVASSSNPAEPLLNHVMESQASAIDAPKDETISGALVDGKHPVKIETLTVQQKWASMQHNERATLNEVQRALLELFPHHAQNMSVLARSYKFIPLNHLVFQFQDFQNLISLLVHYDRIYHQFSHLSKNGDRRLYLDDCKTACLELQFNIPYDVLKVDFSKMDKMGAGYVLYEDFCFYLSAKHL